MICPVRKNSAGDPVEPNEFELNSIRNDPRKLETIRLRLSDLGWWMRVLCQYIAVRANREDNELGKFWQSRFRAVRLLDEAALLACAAYVDLNPIRAAMAETLEQSDYTSVQRRIQSFSPTNDNSTSATLATSQPKQEFTDNLVGAVITAAIGREAAAEGVSPIAMQSRVPADRFLSPIALIPADDQRLGPQASFHRFRCSDKGFPFPIAGGLPGVTRLDRPAGGSRQARNDSPVDAASFSAIERQTSHCHRLGRVGPGFRQIICHRRRSSSDDPSGTQSNFRLSSSHASPDPRVIAIF